MKTIPKQLHTIFATADLDLGRAILAIGSLVWAFILLFFGFQFDRPSYSVYMAVIAPQWVWGLMFLLCGVLQVVRVGLNIPLTSGWYACLVATLHAWLWCFVSTVLWLSLNPPPAMVAGNVALALLSIVILIRAVSKRG